MLRARETRRRGEAGAGSARAAAAGPSPAGRGARLCGGRRGRSLYRGVDGEAAPRLQLRQSPRAQDSTWAPARPTADFSCSGHQGPAAEAAAGTVWPCFPARRRRACMGSGTSRLAKEKPCGACSLSTDPVLSGRFHLRVGMARPLRPTSQPGFSFSQRSLVCSLSWKQLAADPCSVMSSADRCNGPSGTPDLA